MRDVPSGRGGLVETRPHLGSGSLFLGFAVPVHLLSVTFLCGSKQVSHIPFSVKDRHGNTVLRAVANRSFLLLRLPPGEYRISARLDGRTLQRNVEVDESGHSHVSFDFT